MAFDPEKKQQISPELEEFLNAWFYWATTPGAVGFSPRYGLCNNAKAYAAKRGYHRLHDELINIFGEEPYPFGEDAYWNDLTNNAQASNPDRLRWVALQIGVDPDEI